MYLPYHVPHADVVSGLVPFGVVSGVRDVSYPDFDYVHNGTRLVQMLVSSPIPSYVLISGCQCKVSYRGQVSTCRRCAKPGHFARNCDQVVCFRCRLPGHRAANCPTGSGRAAWSSVPGSESSPSFSGPVRGGDVSPSVASTEVSAYVPAFNRPDWSDRVDAEENEVLSRSKEKEVISEKVEKVKPCWKVRGSLEIHESWFAQIIHCTSGNNYTSKVLYSSGLHVFTVGAEPSHVWIVPVSDFFERLKLPYSSDLKINYKEC